MNQDSPQDLFIFNFPKDFVPQEIEDRYKIHLKNYHKPYATILDYLNSTILNINLPGMNFPTVMQNKHQGKEIYSKGSVSPYDVYLREFTVILKSVDFNVSYFIIQDILLLHYINKTKYLENFIITIVDEERREQFKVNLTNIIPTSLSDLPLAYNIKNADSHTFTISCKFNFIDIEYMLKETDGSVLAEKIEDYSDIIIGNSGTPDINI